MIRRPQADHVDLGLVDDDRTEDLREMRNPPAATRGLQFKNPTHRQKEEEVQ